MAEKKKRVYKDGKKPGVKSPFGCETILFTKSIPPKAKEDVKKAVEKALKPYRCNQ